MPYRKARSGKSTWKDERKYSIKGNKLIFTLTRKDLSHVIRMKKRNNATIWLEQEFIYPRPEDIHDNEGYCWIFTKYFNDDDRLWKVSLIELAQEYPHTMFKFLMEKNLQYPELIRHINKVHMVEKHHI